MSYSNVVKSGRAFNGSERDRGTVVHAIQGEEPNGFWGGKALCGTQPGYRGNGWSRVSKQVTCEKCKSKISKYESETQEDIKGTDGIVQ